MGVGRAGPLPGRQQGSLEAQGAQGCGRTQSLLIEHEREVDRRAPGRKRLRGVSINKRADHAILRLTPSKLAAVFPALLLSGAEIGPIRAQKLEKPNLNGRPTRQMAFDGQRMGAATREMRRGRGTKGRSLERGRDHAPIRRQRKAAVKDCSEGIY